MKMMMMMMMMMIMIMMMIIAPSAGVDRLARRRLAGSPPQNVEPNQRRIKPHFDERNCACVSVYIHPKP